MTDRRSISPISAIVTDGSGDLITHKGANFGEFLEFGRTPFARVSELVSSFPHRLKIGGETATLDDLRKAVLRGTLGPGALEFFIYQENASGETARMSVLPIKLSHHDAVVWIFEWVGEVPQWILDRLPKLGDDPIASVAVVPYSYITYADDPDGMGEFHFGPQCRDIFGLTPEEIERDPARVWALVLPEDIDGLMEARRRSMTEKIPFQAHMRIRVGKGIKTLYAETYPKEREDRATVWDGVIIDVTAYNRIRAEEAASHERDLMVARNLGQMVERERVIGELHDGLGSILLELKYRMRNDATPAPELRELVDHAVDELRLIVMAAEHANKPFVDALIALCERLAGSFSDTALRLEWEIDVGDRSILTKKRALNCLRIVQELVANAVKHSKATLVRVTALDLTGSRIQICVEDNGTGLPKGRTRKQGLGLISVEKRARSLEADFAVETGETGTKVCVTVTI